MEVSGDGRTGLLMKNMVTAPTMGTSPIRGSRITRIIPCSWRQKQNARLWKPWMNAYKMADYLHVAVPFRWATTLNEWHVTLTDLYSFDSSFAEVSLHLDVDLYVANIAEDARTKVLLSIVPSSLEVTHKEKLINLHLIYRSSRTWPLSFSVCALIPTTFMAWWKQKNTLCLHDINTMHNLC